MSISIPFLVKSSFEHDSRLRLRDWRGPPSPFTTRERYKRSFYLRDETDIDCFADPLSVDDDDLGYCFIAGGFGET